MLVLKYRLSEVGNISCCFCLVLLGFSLLGLCLVRSSCGTLSSIWCLSSPVYTLFRGRPRAWRRRWWKTYENQFDSICIKLTRDRYRLFGTKYLVSSTRYQVPKYSVPRTWYQVLHANQRKMLYVRSNRSTNIRIGPTFQQIQLPWLPIWNSQWGIYIYIYTYIFFYVK